MAGNFGPMGKVASAAKGRKGKKPKPSYSDLYRKYKKSFQNIRSKNRHWYHFLDHSGDEKRAREEASRYYHRIARQDHSKPMVRKAAHAAYLDVFKSEPLKPPQKLKASDKKGKKGGKGSKGKAKDSKVDQAAKTRATGKFQAKHASLEMMNDEKPLPKLDSFAEILYRPTLGQSKMVNQDYWDFRTFVSTLNELNEKPWEFDPLGLKDKREAGAFFGKTELKSESGIKLDSHRKNVDLGKETEAAGGEGEGGGGGFMANVGTSFAMGAIGAGITKGLTGRNITGKALFGKLKGKDVFKFNLDEQAAGGISKTIMALGNIGLMLMQGKSAKDALYDASGFESITNGIKEMKEGWGVDREYIGNGAHWKCVGVSSGLFSGRAAMTVAGAAMMVDGLSTFLTGVGQLLEMLAGVMFIVAAVLMVLGLALAIFGVGAALMSLAATLMEVGEDLYGIADYVFLTTYFLQPIGVILFGIARVLAYTDPQTEQYTGAKLEESWQSLYMGFAGFLGGWAGDKFGKWGAGKIRGGHNTEGPEGVKGGGGKAKGTKGEGSEPGKGPKGKAEPKGKGGGISKKVGDAAKKGWGVTKKGVKYIGSDILGITHDDIKHPAKFVWTEIWGASWDDLVHPGKVVAKIHENAAGKNKMQHDIYETNARSNEQAMHEMEGHQKTPTEGETRSGRTKGSKEESQKDAKGTEPPEDKKTTRNLHDTEKRIAEIQKEKAEIQENIDVHEETIKGLKKKRNDSAAGLHEHTKKRDELLKKQEKTGGPPEQHEKKIDELQQQHDRLQSEHEKQQQRLKKLQSEMDGLKTAEPKPETKEKPQDKETGKTGEGTGPADKATTGKQETKEEAQKQEISSETPKDKTKTGHEEQDEAEVGTQKDKTGQQEKTGPKKAEGKPEEPVKSPEEQTRQERIEVLQERINTLEGRQKDLAGQMEKIKRQITDEQVLMVKSKDLEQQIIQENKLIQQARNELGALEKQINEEQSAKSNLEKQQQEYNRQLTHELSVKHRLERQRDKAQRDMEKSQEKAGKAEERQERNEQAVADYQVKYRQGKLVHAINHEKNEQKLTEDINRLLGEIDAIKAGKFKEEKQELGISAPLTAEMGMNLVKLVSGEKEAYAKVPMDIQTGKQMLERSTLEQMKEAVEQVLAGMRPPMKKEAMEYLAQEERFVESGHRLDEDMEDRDVAYAELLEIHKEYNQMVDLEKQLEFLENGQVEFLNNTSILLSQGQTTKKRVELKQQKHQENESDHKKTAKKMKSGSNKVSKHMGSINSKLTGSVLKALGNKHAKEGTEGAGNPEQDAKNVKSFSDNPKAATSQLKTGKTHKAMEDRGKELKKTQICLGKTQKEIEEKKREGIKALQNTLVNKGLSFENMKRLKDEKQKRLKKIEQSRVAYANEMTYMLTTGQWWKTKREVMLEALAREAQALHVKELLESDRMNKAREFIQEVDKGYVTHKSNAKKRTESDREKAIKERKERIVRLKKERRQMEQQKEQDKKKGGGSEPEKSKPKTRPKPENKPKPGHKKKGSPENTKDNDRKQPKKPPEPVIKRKDESDKPTGDKSDNKETLISGPDDMDQKIRNRVYNDDTEPV